MLVVAAAVACESSPFEPQGLGERIPLGQKISDEVGGDTVARYSFVGRDSALYAVFFEAVDGSAFLFLSDSLNPSHALGLSGGPGSPPFSENVSPIFSSSAGTVFNIRITAVPSTAHARFTFLVYPIDRAPERRSARFEVGDTVAGETIDPIVDVDEFVVHGEAGQEIVAVGETQGTPGSGSVALNVIDPVPPTLLGYVFADAGTPTLTTNRIRFPASRDYQFFFGSVTSNVYPRYSGPYRFWTYLINRAPEHAARSAPFNTEVSSERLDRAGDVDEFTFVAAANSDFNAFLQSSRPCQLEIVPPTEGAYTVVATPNDTALFAHGTGRFHIAQAGTYTIRFSGTENRIADTGSYRWYLYAIDSRPEHVPAAVTPGDTVSGEDIALPGDIDEFTFSGAPGQEFNVFFQAQSGSSDTRLQLQVLNNAGQVVATTQSSGNDPDLMGQVTGRLSLATAGPYRIRVSGVGSTTINEDRGPYRFLLYPINRAPEHVPEQLSLGDSLSGEAIDASGDIDEFKVNVPDTTGANLVVEFDGVPPAYSWLNAQLIDSASGQAVAALSNGGSGARVASGRVELHPGRYILRVEGYQTQDRPTVRGTYGLWLYRFSLGPEAVGDSFAIGDTVIGESIAPWGDADGFRVYGTRGQHVNLKFQGLGAVSSTELVAYLTPPGIPNENAAVYSPTAGTALGDYQTTRLELPATGWYTLIVRGVGNTVDAQGPYRFVIEAEDSVPEQVNAALVPGDSVMTEPIDPAGDWDQFTVTATASQELGLVFDGRDSFSGDFAYFRAIDPNTGDTLAGDVGQFRRFAGPFHVPSGGRVNVAVFEPGGFSRQCGDATCGGTFGLTGLYGLHIVAINRAPETVPAAYTVGDTVRGETISPIGDIDEFTGSATPGDTLTLYGGLTVTSSLDSAIVLEIIDPATGTSLGGSNAAFFGAGFFPVVSFAVAPSGTYIVRAHAYGEHGYGVGTTAYQFFVKRGL